MPQAEARTGHRRRRHVDDRPVLRGPLPRPPSALFYLNRSPRPQVACCATRLDAHVQDSGTARGRARRTNGKRGLTRNYLTIVVSTHMGALPYAPSASTNDGRSAGPPGLVAGVHGPTAMVLSSVKRTRDHGHEHRVLAVANRSWPDAEWSTTGS